MKSAAVAAAALAAAARGAAAAVTDLAAVDREMWITDTNKEATDIAVSKFTDASGIVCYLGPWPGTTEGQGQRGYCKEVIRDIHFGHSLVQLSDSTLHNALSRLNMFTNIWCYADAENSYELKCRKVNHLGYSLAVEESGELSVKGNSVNVLGSSVISVAGFSDGSAVVCSDNPGVQAANPNPTGPLQCALLIIMPTDDEWCPSCLNANSNTGIKSLSTDSIVSLSVLSFTETKGAACYTSSGAGGTKVSCTALLLSGRDIATSTLDFGNTLTISDGAASAAAVALSASSGMVCYTTKDQATACTKVQLTGTTLTKGDEFLVGPFAAPRLSLAAFSGSTAVGCFEVAPAGAFACKAMDTEDGALGAALIVDDAKAGQQLALTSWTSNAGLLCYQTTSGRGVCKDVLLSEGTATTMTTTFATETVTETSGTTITTATSGTTTTTRTYTTGTTTTFVTETTTFATETASGTSSTTITAASATATDTTGTTVTTVTGAATLDATTSAAATGTDGSPTVPEDVQQALEDVLSGAAGARCAAAFAVGALALLA